MTSTTLVAAVALVLVVLGVAGLLWLPFAPVSRNRLERFARRQALPITVDNGPVVIAYLAITRRWRGGVMGTSVLITGVYSWARDSGPNVSSVAVFAGWFVGAVLAEWRVGATGQRGPRRSALLVPRRMSDYVPKTIVLGAAIAITAVVGVEIAVLATARADRGVLAACLAATVGVAAGIRAVGQHILTRAQPPAEPDVLAADDALRSRSLHVLAGCALAIAGYLFTIVSNVAARQHLWLDDRWGGLAGVLGIAMLPLLGFFAATAPFATPTRLTGAVNAAR